MSRPSQSPPLTSADKASISANAAGNVANVKGRRCEVSAYSDKAENHQARHHRAHWNKSDCRSNLPRNAAASSVLKAWMSPSRRAVNAASCCLIICLKFALRPPNENRSSFSASCPSQPYNRHHPALTDKKLLSAPVLLVALPAKSRSNVREISTQNPDPAHHAGPKPLIVRKAPLTYASSPICPPARDSQTALI